jgi:hypothetical protein
MLLRGKGRLMRCGRERGEGGWLGGARNNNEPGSQLTYNRMDERAQTEFLAEFSTAARSALSAQRDLLDGLPSDHPAVANMKDGLACCELALTFYEEANRAVQASVWFAAAAVAAAALEAMLLAKMFTNTDEVARLAPFRKLLDKHHGDFGSFARKEMDLGKLLDMAKELAWFRPGGVPRFLTEMLSHYVDLDTLTALTVIFKDSSSAGYTSADLLRQYRNLLHPAYCLKQDIRPTKDTGIRATYFCLVAYASLGTI